MPHIHTGPGEYDPTASAYLVLTNQEEPRLLLHWHKNLKVFMQFGGHIETTENPWKAIAHELREESGYDLSQCTVLQPKASLRHLSGVTLHPTPVSSLTHKFSVLDHYHSDLAYALVTAEEPQGAVSEGESLRSQTFTATELRELDPTEIPDNVREIGLFVLTVCMKEWEQVPVSNFTL